MKSVLIVLLLFVTVIGCRSVTDHRELADAVATNLIGAIQLQEYGQREAIDVETSADTLRRRLLLDQALPNRSAASAGLRDLPATEYWKPSEHLSVVASTGAIASATNALTLSLMDALQLAAASSWDYQSAKEDLFRAALALDLEQSDFRRTFAGAASGQATHDRSGGDSVNTVQGSGELGVTKRLLSGVAFSTIVAVDLVKLLTQSAASSFGIQLDASVAIPLLRGAGRRIAAEPLRQAERNVLYEILDFERFKQTIAVGIASQYFGVLRQERQTLDAEANYQRLVDSAQRARRLADAGRLPEFQLDQAVQDELRARVRWIDARRAYEARLDDFKVAVGLPPDARLTLDARELVRLRDNVNVDAPATGEEADDHVAVGTFAEDQAHAIVVALTNRVDLRASELRIEDAQRAVYIAADALGAEVTLLGRAAIGGRRSSAGSAGQPDAELKPSRGNYSALLTLDLPVERTAERVAYRNSILALQRTVRNYQAAEDAVKLDVRNALRDLQNAAETVVTQRKAVELAEKRVRSTDLFLQSGRAQIRDVLESQEALLNAQNALTAAVVSYRIADLELQRDMGVLRVDAGGLWHESSLKERME